MYNGTKMMAIYFIKYSELVDRHFTFAINASLKSFAISDIVSAPFSK